MRVGFLIKVRLKSKRLKNKPLLEINGLPMIVHMIRRIKKFDHLFSNIIICTSTNSQDNPLEEIAYKENIDIFRGSENDVLKRYYETSVKYKLDFLIKTGADNPLVSLDFAKDVIKYAKEKSPGLITLTKLPIGLFFYGISPISLKKVIDRKTVNDTEIWGHLFKKQDDIIIYDFPINSEYIRSNYRLTVDYFEDFKVVQMIFKFFSDAIYDRSTLDILKFLDNNVDILNINKNNQDMYIKNFNKINKY